jgi:hypothetical protein
MYVTPTEQRHDPVTARPARTLREVDDDPRGWWEPPGAANDRLIGPAEPRSTWRARALRVAVALAFLIVPAAIVVERWVRP